MFVGPIQEDLYTPPFYAVRHSEDGTADLAGSPAPAGIPGHDPPQVLTTEAYTDDGVSILRVVAIEHSWHPFTGQPVETRSLLYLGVEQEPFLVDAYLVATTGLDHVGCGREWQPETAVVVREDWRSLRAFVEIEPARAIGQIDTMVVEEPDCSVSGVIHWVHGKGFAFRTLEPGVRRSRPRSVVIDDQGRLRFYFDTLVSR